MLSEDVRVLIGKPKTRCLGCPLVTQVVHDQARIAALEAENAALLAVEQAARERKERDCEGLPTAFCDPCGFLEICAALARLDEARGGGR